MPFSETQFEQALQDLLAMPEAGPRPLVADIEFELVDRPWVTTATLGATLRKIEQAVEQLDQAALGQVLGCAQLTDAGCMEAGLSRFAARAFSRPVGAEELQQVMTIHADGVSTVADSGVAATRAALTAVLLSPSTLYRTEFESGSTLSPYERVAAVAAFLLDGVPDEALLSAAADGSISTPQGLRVQVDRLLALPHVREHLTDLVMASFRLPKLLHSPKDQGLFPEFTGELVAAMLTETRMLVDDVLWTRGAPVSELLTSDVSFLDGQLADLYGVQHTGSDPTAFVAVQMPPERTGLLTHASLLSTTSRTNKTSVVARGLFVRGAVMCLTKISSPPANIQAQIEEQLSSDSSERALAEYRAMTSPCMSCHSQFDRFGLLMEEFDAIGRKTTGGGEVIDLTGLDILTGTASSSRDLAELAVGDGQFTRCFAERMLDYALAQTQGGSARCLSDPLHANLPQGQATLTDVVMAVLSHPAFSTRIPE